MQFNRKGIMPYMPSKQKTNMATMCMINHFSGGGERAESAPTSFNMISLWSTINIVIEYYWYYQILRVLTSGELINHQIIPRCF